MQSELCGDLYEVIIKANHHAIDKGSTIGVKSGIYFLLMKNVFFCKHKFSLYDFVSRVRFLRVNLLMTYVDIKVDYLVQKSLV